MHTTRFVLFQLSSFLSFFFSGKCLIHERPFPIFPVQDDEVCDTTSSEGETRHRYAISDEVSYFILNNFGCVKPGRGIAFAYLLPRNASPSS